MSDEGGSHRRPFPPTNVGHVSSECLANMHVNFQPTVFHERSRRAGERDYGTSDHFHIVLSSFWFWLIRGRYSGPDNPADPGRKLDF